MYFLMGIHGQRATNDSWHNIRSSPRSANEVSAPWHKFDGQWHNTHFASEW